MSGPGTEFARGFLAKKFDDVGSLFADSGSFFMSTPGRTWDAVGPDGVIKVISGFVGDDGITTETVSIKEEPIGNRHHLVFRFLVGTGGRNYECEQHAYYDLDDAGKIAKMRVLCSGWLPIT